MEPCAAKPLCFKPSATIKTAVDAATNDEEHNPLAAAIIFQKDGTENVVVEPFQDPSYHIALGELQAIWMAVKEAVKGQSNVLIVLATDSMVAKHWVETGVAHNEQALDLLAAIDSLLKASGSRLYCVYVNTKDNISDVPSRLGKDGYLAEFSTPANSDKRRATLKLLGAAADEAKQTFLASGGKYGGMNRSEGN